MNRIRCRVEPSAYDGYSLVTLATLVGEESQHLPSHVPQCDAGGATSVECEIVTHRDNRMLVRVYGVPHWVRPIDVFEDVA